MKSTIGLIWLLLGLFILIAGFFTLKNNPEILAINESSSLRITNNSPSPSPTPESKKRVIKWGAYAGKSVSEKIDFEHMIGKKPDFVATFLLWGDGNYFPSELASNAKHNGQTLVIYWESRDEKSRNLNDKRYSYDAIISGEWNDYIVSIAQTIRESETQVILIPFIEMNGNWYPWSITKNNNSAEKHVLAYRKIRDLTRDIPNLKLGWVVNNGSAPEIPENSISMLYPGSDFVDYVGVDGFNFGKPWESFSEVFDKSLILLKVLKKPIIIFSMASADSKGKSEWIDDMGSQLLKHPEIEGFIWFNEDKERDWRIWSDSKSLESFKKLLKVIE